MSASLKYYDLSPVLSSQTAVFPGDTPFSRQVEMDFSKGDHLTLSNIRTTVHIGAHTDAPSHYHRDGATIENQPLDRYWGDCQVLSVNLPRGARITPKDLGASKISAPRVLFKTRSFPNPNLWNGDFNSLSGPLVNFLADQGVLLVGIDTPSIDPAEDKILESHQAVYARGLAILEGIILDAVPEGIYHLAALPLPLASADASPVRAVLFPRMANASGGSK